MQENRVVLCMGLRQRNNKSSGGTSHRAEKAGGKDHPQGGGPPESQGAETIPVIRGKGEVCPLLFADNQWITKREPPFFNTLAHYR